jgi:hypothetical protein
VRNSTVLHFANLFKVSHSCNCHTSASNLLLFNALAEVYKENLAPNKYIVRKERSILVAFPDHHGYSFVLHQNSTSDSVRSVTTWNLNLHQSFHSVTLTTTGLVCTLNGSFTHTWSITLPHEIFRKYSLLSYADLPNVDIFYYSLAKLLPLTKKTFF